MSSINVYLHFNGNCREAMNFYKECIGGNLDLQTVAGSPLEAQCPAAMKDNVMHATLTKGNLVLMASDMMGPGGYQKGNNIALTLNCDSEEEINSLFGKLSVGGKVIDPLKKQFWGALFGVFEDKFGIRWMLNYDQNVKQAANAPEKETAIA
jgi:PhnB protein